MKNKKGFTLIELMAIIAILSLLAMVATPKVIDVINNNRNKAFSEIEQRLEDASNLFDENMNIVLDIMGGTDE